MDAASLEPLQIMVSRANLFQDSMNRVMSADPSEFYAGVSVEFESEAAQGDGVLREWLCLICNYLLDPKNKLFIASPNDPRRFSPDPKRPMYENIRVIYRFAGRIVSLALKHQVQIGILFDPLFFQQLQGKTYFSLEDLILTDTDLYTQYKRLLEMEADELEECNLTLSEFFANGDKMRITTETRERYVQLMVMERYYHQISDQVHDFSDGVQDMIDEGSTAKTFFSLLNLEDLDSMLRGSEEDIINVAQWQLSTGYEDYQPDDNVIIWFWEVLSQMGQEDLHRLLYFWTSHRFLPRDGFSGLPKLWILKMETPKESTPNYKPRSQTCCYSLYLPDYITYEQTERAVHYIANEEIAFGEL